jgi:hypothetical protein
MTAKFETMQSPKGTVWTVPLPRNRKYPYTLFHRGRGEEYNYAVVMVDVKKLLDCHARLGQPVLPLELWDKDEIRRMVKFMRPAVFDAPSMEKQSRYVQEAQDGNGHLGSVEMPIAHIELQSFVERPGLLGYLRLTKRLVELPVVSFANGRHRAHFVHAMGVKAFPVEVLNEQAELLREFCGI